MGPFVVSAWKFGAIEPRRRLHHQSARRLQSCIRYMERAYGAGRSSPVEAIFSVGRHDELYEKGLLVG